MTERQRRFCDEYIISGNATQAAIEAGYSPRTAKQIGQENLTKPDLNSYISEQLARLHSEKTADGQEVLEYLTSVLRGESTAHVLSMCGDGRQEVIAKPPDEKERLKAAELLGKRFGLFKDSVTVDGDLDLNIRVDYGDSPDAGDG
ncbi:MAG: terminase small subunit [Clostridiales bacterium]|nr:terminase small subunit [Clostridiales bacterium]